MNVRVEYYLIGIPIWLLSGFFVGAIHPTDVTWINMAISGLVAITEAAILFSIFRIKKND